MTSQLSSITSTLWDTVLAGLIVGLTLMWPDIFPTWMALSALPLLATRAAIASIESRLEA